MKREPETAEVLNNFFSDIVKNLIILESMRISIQILKTLKIEFLKQFQKITTTKVSLLIKEKFYFHEVSNEKLEKEIRRLNGSKKIRRLKSRHFY